jgi:hypothetical protein
MLSEETIAERQSKWTCNYHSVLKRQTTLWDAFITWWFTISELTWSKRLVLLRLSYDKWRLVVRRAEVETVREDAPDLSLNSNYCCVSSCATKGQKCKTSQETSQAKCKVNESCTLFGGFIQSWLYKGINTITCEWTSYHCLDNGMRCCDVRMVK